MQLQRKSAWRCNNLFNSGKNELKLTNKKKIYKHDDHQKTSFSFISKIKKNLFDFFSPKFTFFLLLMLFIVKMKIIAKCFIIFVIALVEKYLKPGIERVSERWRE